MGQQFCLGQNALSQIHSIERGQLFRAELGSIHHGQLPQLGILGQLDPAGDNGIDGNHSAGLVGGIVGNGHVVGIADGTLVKDKGLGGLGVDALGDAAGHGEGAVAHVHHQFAIGKHGIHGGGGIGESLSLIPQVGIQLPQVVQGGLNGSLDGVVVGLHGLELLPAADFIDDVADKGAAGKIGQSGIGHLARILPAEGHQFLGGGGQLGCHSGIGEHNQLCLGIGGFVALDGHAEVTEGLGIGQIDILIHIWQFLGERTIEKAVFLGGVEVLTIDPDHIDAALGGIRLLLTGKLGQDIVDVHAHHFQGDIILLLQMLCHGGVQPVVAVFVAAPAVKSNGGTLCRSYDFLPGGIIQVNFICFLAAAEEGQRHHNAQQQYNRSFHVFFLSSG